MDSDRSNHLEHVFHIFPSKFKIRLFTRFLEITCQKETVITDYFTDLSWPSV